MYNDELIEVLNASPFCVVDIKDKLKAMLTQVHRGESAPRVTGGHYPQGLKASGS